MMLTDKECREWHDRLNPLKQGQQPLKETSCGETVQREGNKASSAYTFVSSMEADFDSSNNLSAIQEGFERSEASISFEKSQDNVLNLLVAKLVKE